jgi:hypothetical protein
LSIIRTVLAVLIAISLALALGPGASAFAVAHESDMAAMVPNAEAGMDMPDCHKAMGGTTSTGCKCCDTKSKCPDQATCLLKCFKVIGAITSPAKTARLVRVRYRPSEPEKPPNWARTPPFPPPRS